MMTRVSQLWDLIETWSFCEDIKDDEVEENDKDDDNNGNGISALGLYRDLVYHHIEPP